MRNSHAILLQVGATVVVAAFLSYVLYDSAKNAIKNTALNTLRKVFSKGKSIDEHQ
jgi:hypothetical protein